MMILRLALILSFLPVLFLGMAHAGGEIESLQKALITKAAEIQSLEHEIKRTNIHLQQLRAKLAEIEKSRQNHTKAQKAASASLIRLARRPESMPLVAGLELARGELILHRTQKQIDHLLSKLVKRNGVIAQLTSDVQKNEEALKNALSERIDIHHALENLLEDKRHGLKTPNSAYWIEQAKKIEQSAAKARSTNMLISDIIKKTQLHGAKKKQNIPKLLIPGTGKLVTGFADKNSLGMNSSELGFEMISGARITSPIGGQIVFAGPFRSYGQILIISAPGGYHVILRGMARLDVRAGEAISAGEPVGLMASVKKRKMSSKKPYNANPRLTLYLEVRQHGRPIDPAALFAEKIP